MTDIFHETKRERKFYEGKKQKALRFIDNLFSNITMGSSYSHKPITPDQLKRLRNMVNDI